MNTHNFASGVEFKFVATVPVQPGFFVLGVLSGDKGEPVEVMKYPIVAWALEEDTLAPYAVTLEGVHKENAFILQPDGVVEQPGICGFASVEEWFADRQSEYARSKAGK